MIQFLILFAINLAAAETNLDYYHPQELEMATHYWPRGIMENSTIDLNAAIGCTHCGEAFYYEPPPDDIMYIPSPPLHPSYYSSLADMIGSSKKLPDDQCNFCNLFYNEGEQLISDDAYRQGLGSKVVPLLATFLSISALLSVYIISSKRSKIIASLTRTNLFKSNQPPTTAHQLAKSGSQHESISNTGVHLTDPCFIQTNRDKNFTSPIISDHVPHKKTSIPSKYWAQPGSIIGRTIRRIPNEYEVPSSRTNSTGTSSAVYADMNNENNQRFFSPYNLHTYAEVREVLDQNDHFHTSSNSSVMLSESNYDNNYPHGNCVSSGGVGTGLVIGAPNGSVQMSDFNSMRPVQSTAYGQPLSVNHHHQLSMAKPHHSTAQSLYEQPPQRAQVIITSNNQGVNPTLLNYKERVHNVI